MTLLQDLRLPIRAAAAAAVLLFAFAIVDVPSLLAQEAGLPGTRMAEQNLRPYWHVFAAYTIVIALIGGWAFSIARRLRRLEERLVD